MFVLGAGTAIPPVELSDATLGSLGLAQEPARNAGLVSRAGVRCRRISLPLEYVASTKNADILEGRKVAIGTPTTLGIEAAHQALSNAGIGIEQVGLLLADTATPYQTCPSEAQRIGGAFNVKVPAYDVVGGVGAITHFFNMLSQWRAERVPEYVLVVSTNTPSQQVAYGSDVEAAWLYGDSAAAFVVSRKHVGKYSVVHAASRSVGSSRPAIVVERNIVHNPSLIPSSEELSALLNSELELLTTRFPDILTTGFFIFPQLFSAECKTLAATRGISSDRVVSGVEECGYSFGSSSGVALASIWQKVAPGQKVTIIHCGDGVCGSSVLVSS